MSPEQLISVTELSSHYEVEFTFFSELNEIGLIEFVVVDQDNFIHQDHISDLEKMIRIHNELHINLQGIDAVFNLLKKVNDLQDELTRTQNRLRIYEERID